MAKQKYFLRPNDRICKIRKDLKGGKCEVVTDKEYKELTEEQIKIFEVNIPFYLTAKRLVTEIPEIKEADGKDSEKTKSDKRIALEKEATELGVEFTDRTSQADLKAEIEAKKAELEADSGDSE